MRCSNSRRLLDLLESVVSTAKVRQGRHKKHTRCFHLSFRLFLKWWEGYQDETTVLVDNFRKDWCKHHELLKSLDLHLDKVKKESWPQLIHDHDDYFVL